MQEEVQCPDVRKLEAFDTALAEFAKMLLHTLSGDFADQDRVVPILDRDKADVRSVSLVSRSGVSDLYQANPHHLNSNGTPQSTVFSLTSLQG